MKMLSLDTVRNGTACNYEGEKITPEDFPRIKPTKPEDFLCILIKKIYFFSSESSGIRRARKTLALSRPWPESELVSALETFAVYSKQDRLIGGERTRARYGKVIIFDWRKHWKNLPILTNAVRFQMRQNDVKRCSKSRCCPDILNGNKGKHVQLFTHVMNSRISSAASFMRDSSATSINDFWSKTSAGKQFAMIGVAPTVNLKYFPKGKNPGARWRESLSANHHFEVNLLLRGKGKAAEFVMSQIYVAVPKPLCFTNFRRAMMSVLFWARSFLTTGKLGREAAKPDILQYSGTYQTYFENNRPLTSEEVVKYFALARMNVKFELPKEGLL